MKKVYLLLALVVIIILTLLLFRTPFVRSLPHRLEASKIPKYENAETWEVGGSCQDMYGGGSCSGYIYFKTNDDADTVVTFYKEKLADKGWTVGEETNLLDVHGNKLPDKYVFFTKENAGAELTYQSKEVAGFNYIFSITKR